MALDRALVPDTHPFYHGQTHYALKQALTWLLGLMHSPLAGSFLNNQIRLMFSQQNPRVPIVPYVHQCLCLFEARDTLSVALSGSRAATYMSFASVAASHPVERVQPTYPSHLLTLSP